MSVDIREGYIDPTYPKCWPV